LSRSSQSLDVIVPGRYEVDRIGHRRPELYRRVVE
jgi:hypothetical protein